MDTLWLCGLVSEAMRNAGMRRGSDVVATTRWGASGRMAMLLVVLLNLWSPQPIEALNSQLGVGAQSAPTSARARLPSTGLYGVSKSQVAVLDGAEWVSVQRLLQEQGRHPQSSRPSKIGYMTVVTGTVQDDRVVGIQAAQDGDKEEEASTLDTISLSNSVEIYKDSMATIPDKMNDKTAIQTLIASLGSIHCALPLVDHVGGSDEGTFVSGKVVVLGGSDFACFAADGLAAMGAKVHMVSTNNPKSISNQVHTLTPAVGEMALGFSDYIGEFDALLDTMSDEARGRVVLNSDTSRVGGVVEELAKQHSCLRYVSTMAESQRIVRDEGVLFGPKQADQHVSDVAKAVRKRQSFPGDSYQQVIPPANFGRTLQTLLDKDVTFSWKSKSNDVTMRGWALKDFWELTTWPRDSSANVRFGLPVRESSRSLYDDDDEPMVSDPSDYLREKFKIGEGMTQTQLKEAADEREEAANNPFVTSIEGVQGLQLDIVLPKRDCLLFLSAPFCRTCKSLSPQYTRMAREHEGGSVAFFKADASGKKGKLLGKVLEVEAVPSFVIFREGKLYGTPLGVTRLPSKKLDRALEYLRDGMEWDSSILQEDTKDAK